MELNVPDTVNGAITFGVAGLVLIFAAMVGIGLILTALPMLLGTQRRDKSASQDPQIEPLEEGHVAAISAALATVVGAYRIVRIEPHHNGVVWQTEGRAAQHGSHSLSHPSPSRRHDKEGHHNGAEVQNHRRRAAI
jgi:hypothetical protein